MHINELSLGVELNHYAEQLMLKLKEFFHESYPELLPSFLSICKSSCVSYIKIYSCK